MQYSFAKACLLALATTNSVLAQIPGFNVLTAPASNEVVEAGSKYTIKWTPSDPAAPISLVLMQGKDAQHLDLASDFIIKAIDSAAGQFEWSVPASATFAAYGIKLQLDSDPEQFQYSNPFTIAGGSDASESSTASEPSQTTSAESGKSTTTIQVSQISTAPTTSATKALSTSTKPKPTSTSTTSTSEEPTSTEESSTVPSTTEVPATTPETSIAVPTSIEAPTATASPTFTGAAPRNAIVGSGLIGAMTMVFALL